MLLPVQIVRQSWNNNTRKQFTKKKKEKKKIPCLLHFILQYKLLSIWDNIFVTICYYFEINVFITFACQKRAMYCVPLL